MTIERHEFLGMPAIFASLAMAGLMEKVRRYALTDGVVLIEGESGVGKEAVARALHCYSLRQSKPWVDVSCATLPEHLVESELFGHEKGAFSGADQFKQGLFELADEGTLFLDEIGELPVHLQGKLLRILDSGEYFRIGGTRKVRINVRILSATNRDLQRGIAEGWFRHDLYHRLAQLRLQVPPLRERPDDILALSEFFVESMRPGTRISEEVQNVLLHYSWPGNVRELRNALMGCLAAASDGRIELEHVPEEVARVGLFSTETDVRQLLQLAEAVGTCPAPQAGARGLLHSAERALIQRALTITNGHQQRAAKILGISPRTLSRKLKTFRFSGTGEGPAAEAV